MRDRGTTAVLLVDLAATLAAVAFAAVYTHENLLVFAPVLLVTLFVSVLVAVLVRGPERDRSSPSRDTSSRRP